MLLKEGVKESPSCNLRELFNQSAIIANTTTVANAKTNFLQQQNVNIADIINMPQSRFDDYLKEIVKILVERGNAEIGFFESEQKRVMQLNREDAIKELLRCLKLDNKISTIMQFVEQIR